MNDYSSAEPPTLIITNAIIKNFNYHKFAVSFISLGLEYGGNLNIESSTFNNFLFPYGLITNAPTTSERDSAFFGGFGLKNCLVSYYFNNLKQFFS